jgi:hypothetical protein
MAMHWMFINHSCIKFNSEIQFIVNKKDVAIVSPKVLMCEGSGIVLGGEQTIYYHNNRAELNGFGAVFQEQFSQELKSPSDLKSGCIISFTSGYCDIYVDGHLKKRIHEEYELVGDGVITFKHQYMKTGSVLLVEIQSRSYEVYLESHYSCIYPTLWINPVWPNGAEFELETGPTNYD